MDFEFISENLKDAREGDDRDYLDGKADIHESSLELQKNVEKEYLRLVDEEEDFFRIDCFGENRDTLPPEVIHGKIIALLKDKQML
jgi:dTMP kinase